MNWKLKTRTLCFDRRPLVMGIVNVTPDSFSDGGRFHHVDAAIRHARQLINDGADIIDIGGESTRPYSDPVASQEELDRVVPVIEKLGVSCEVPISIDTSKSRVASAAVEAGAEIINDVTGLSGDTRMLDVAIRTEAGLCIMHMQGTPQDMQDDPQYSNVTEEIRQYLQLRCDDLVNAGVDRERICVDPGIGFGKTHHHNLQLLAEVEEFHNIGQPLLIGHSRKGFVRKFSGDESKEQLPGTLAVSLMMAQAGVHIIRVHDVRETVMGLKMWRAVEQPRR